MQSRRLELEFMLTGCVPGSRAGSGVVVRSSLLHRTPTCHELLLISGPPLRPSTNCCNLLEESCLRSIFVSYWPVKTLSSLTPQVGLKPVILLKQRNVTAANPCRTALSSQLLTDRVQHRSRWCFNLLNTQRSLYCRLCAHSC